jgi:predicted Zn-dependent protease
MVLVPVISFFSACGSLGAVASAGAQIAASAGIIDDRAASAIGKTGEALDAINRAREDISPEQEYYIGRAVGANILSNYKVYTGNPALTAYLNRICNAIAINSPRPEIWNGYHVNILDSSEINAFATSGGHIFITRGLIACADSEDALAGVIAHEISHIQLQHSLESIMVNRKAQAALSSLAAVSSGLGAAGVSVGGMNLTELTEAFGESVKDQVATMIDKGYSQDQEFEADETALSLMASAGYDPQGLIVMLHSLEKNQAGHPGGFNKTHPSPARRVASAEKFVSAYRVRDTRSFREARYRAAAK